MRGRVGVTLMVMVGFVVGVVVMVEVRSLAGISGVSVIVTVSVFIRGWFLVKVGVLV